MDYYFNCILEVGNDNKVLFWLIDCFFYRKVEKSYLISILVEDFVNIFVIFFEDKIICIRSIFIFFEILDYFFLLDIFIINCEFSNFLFILNFELLKIVCFVV